MNVLILRTGIPESIFLRASLHIYRLDSLRFGKKLYVEWLVESMALTSSVVIYVENPLKGFREAYALVQKEPLTSPLSESASVIYIDMRFFPSDIECLRRIIEKGLFAKSPLWASDATDAMPPELPFFMAPYKVLPALSNIVDGPWDDLQNSRLTNILGLFHDIFEPSTLLRIMSDGLQLRHFNHLTIEGEYFRKTSTQREKIRAEHSFLSRIPDPVKPYFPQTGGFQDNGDSASYLIEKIFMIDVGKALLNGSFRSEERIDRFLDRLKKYLVACPRRRADKLHVRKIMYDMFIDKAQDRFAAVQQLPCIEKINLLCRMRGYASLDHIRQKLFAAIVDVVKGWSETDLVFSHGDLFFGNILYDTNTTQMKLVDPRGLSSSEDDGFAPQMYDLAKLSHSFLGMYDLLAYDLAEIVIDPELKPDLRYHVITGEVSYMQRAFEKLLNDLERDVRIVRLFEASLFLSMLPLHGESPYRIMCQTLQCIRSFEAATMKGSV